MLVSLVVRRRDQPHSPGHGPYPSRAKQLIAGRQRGGDQRGVSKFRRHQWTTSRRRPTHGALLESGARLPPKAVLAWEKRNTHENEVGSYLKIGGRRLGPFYTFGEISRKIRASWIREQMDALRSERRRVGK